MVVGFTTTYICNQCLLPLTLWVWTLLRWGLLDTTLCDRACQWLVTGRWFSPGTPFSSTNKTDCHDITEILLKVALNTMTLTPLLLVNLIFEWHVWYFSISCNAAKRHFPIYSYQFFNHGKLLIFNWDGQQHGLLQQNDLNLLQVNLNVIRQAKEKDWSWCKRRDNDKAGL
jgi:hypothetical protein